MKNHVKALTKKFSHLDSLLYNEGMKADIDNEIITYMTDSDELVPVFDD